MADDKDVKVEDDKDVKDAKDVTADVKDDKGEKTYTQAEYNAAAAAARKESAAEAKAGKAAIARLAEIEAANKTDAEKQADLIATLKADKEAAEGRATKAETDALKQSIGIELGIPASLRSRLTGTTEEELRADATSVAAELHIEPPKVPIGGGGRPLVTAPEAALTSKMREAAGLK